MFLLGATAGVGIWQSFHLVTIVPVALGWLVYELVTLPIRLMAGRRATR